MAISNWLKNKIDLRSLNLVQRLVIFYLAFSFLPMMLIGLVTYQRSIRITQDEIINYSNEITNQINKHLTSRFIKLRNDSIDISFNEDIVRFMSTYDSLSPSQLARERNLLLSLMTSKLTFSDEVGEVVLISNDGHINYTYSNQRHKLYFYPDFISRLISEVEQNELVWLTITNQDSYRRSELFDKSEIGRDLLMADNEAGIVFVKKVKDLYTGVSFGYLVLNLKESLIDQIFSTSLADQGNVIFLLNDDFKIVASSNPDLILSSDFPSDDFRLKFKNSIIDNEMNNIFSLYSRQNREIISYQKIDVLNWYVISQVSGQYLYRKSQPIGLFILYFAFASLILAALTLLLLSRGILVPIRKIINIINKVKQGDMNAKINDTHQDELGIVAASFDEMTDEIQSLINRIKEDEKLRRQLEFDMLQSKMNPHFIANALNSAAWLADIQKADNIVLIIKSLNYLINESLKDSNEVIIIAKEIESIEKYLNIQRFRYVYNINLIVQVPDDLMKMSIPKFTIQPLVENSVLHGHANDNKEITIIIKAIRLEDKVKITVIDNGKGLASKTLKFDHDEERIDSNQSHGIGLSNVNQRLKLYYGEEFGLSINSVPGQFTIAEFFIPFAADILKS